MTSASDVAAHIEAYISAAPEAMRDPVRAMRRIMADAAPDAVEHFYYGLAGFKYMGWPLLYCGAPAKHYAVHGNTESAVSALQQDVKGLDISKGTIRSIPPTLSRRRW